jgi:hypothetical protein
VPELADELAVAAGDDLDDPPLVQHPVARLPLRRIRARTVSPVTAPPDSPGGMYRSPCSSGDSGTTKPNPRGFAR